MAHLLMKVRGCLFDLDGTVAQSELLKAEAIQTTISHYGGYVSRQAYAEVMGQTWSKVRRFLLSEAKVKVSDSEFDAQYRAEYARLIDAFLEETEGVSQFIKSCKEHDIATSIVTSTSRSFMMRVLQKLNLADQFDGFVSGDDVISHKPNPEPYLKALEKLRLPEWSVVVFEDSDSGVASALAAGCKCFAIRHEYNSRHSLAGASAILESFTNQFSLLENTQCF